MNHREYRAVAADLARAWVELAEWVEREELPTQVAPKQPSPDVGDPT
jgi:hypothetical protein